MQDKGNLWSKLKNGRIKEWLFVLLFAAVLCVLAWVVFYDNRTDAATDVTTLGTDTEKKLTAILEQIEGVGEVEVMISEEEEPTVVIVCDGGKDLQVIIRVREAAAAAVGTKEQNVKIYVRDNN